MTAEAESALEEAINAVKAAGYVVLKEKSYRQAQERQRVAEALRKLEQEHNEHTRAWANRAFDEQRRLADRCEYLYGLATRLGACDRQLRGDLEELRALADKLYPPHDGHELLAEQSDGSRDE